MEEGEVSSFCNARKNFMTDKDNEAKKPLTRDQILKANNGFKMYQLRRRKTILPLSYHEVWPRNRKKTGVGGIYKVMCAFVFVKRKGAHLITEKGTTWIS